MQIRNLYTEGLEELYGACLLKQNGNTNKFKFNKDLINLYNHIELTYSLIDVSIYEYMLLKKYATTCSKLYNKHVLYESVDYNLQIRDYARLIKKITEDKEIVNTPIKYNYPYLYGPCFLIRGECQITLSGRELISIFDIDPANTFILGTKGGCVKEQGKPDFIEEFNLSTKSTTGELFNHFLKEKFLSSFYNGYFISTTTSSDMLSDTAIHKFFSQHNKLVDLESITNPIYKYTKTKNNLNDIPKIRERYKEDSELYLSREGVLEDTYLTLNLYTRFSTFLNLFENLPKEFFISSEDLKIPSNFREIYIPIEFSNKYSDKLEDVYSELEIYLKNEQKNFFVKYQCTYLNSYYSYSIKLKLNDINMYVNTVDKKELLPESVEVIDSIIRFGRATLKMF